MLINARVLSFALLLAAPVALQAQATEGSITKELQGMRALPTAQRPAASLKAAGEIASLPAGLPKVKLAYGLCGLTTEVDAGEPVFTAVAQTLALALKENPLPLKTPDAPVPAPYLELARLVRYMHATAPLDSPMMPRAFAQLDANDADIAKADFTLKDLKGKPVTLSQLKGKVVMVNFWATWCPPCRKEMPDLDAIYEHYKDQLVILSISDEEMFKVGTFINQSGYHPPVLLDPGGKIAKMYHVDGIPKSFVYDKDGKFVEQSIDELTQRQFLQMLSRAGLKPA
jgi:thiol-disulfide isomerase/thioredoxin